MNSEDRWFVLELQAEPWAVGPLGIARKGGKTFPYIGPNQKVQAYQNALRELLDGAGVLAGEVEIKLYIWRQIETMKISGQRDRKGHVSDATNIQKATEDALQGVLIENDRYVRRITTELMEQKETTKPRIILHVGRYYPSDEGDIPDYVWGEFDNLTKKEAPLDLFDRPLRLDERLAITDPKDFF